ncbi:MAG: RES domain-containing protein, partial [Rubrobacteraceae bacterium]
MSTITTWRICAPKYADTAFSGEGARIYGGRWNSKGRAVVYSSESNALAVLEQLVHVEDPAILDAFVVVSASLNKATVEVLSLSSLPDGWRAYP